MNVSERPCFWVFKATKGFKTVKGAAKALCAKARESRMYGGMSMDDISVVVVDIGGSSTVGGDPTCGANCVVQ